MHFFWPPRPNPVLNSSSLFLSILFVCIPGRSVLALNLGALHSDWFDSILRRLGPGRGKNRAIKRFRNRASSNHDFISISINRTALISSYYKYSEENSSS